MTRCLASGCVEHLKIIQLFVQNICQACFPQAGTHFQSSALAEQGPTRREMGADPCHSCGVSSCSFPLLVLPTNQTLPLMLCQAVAFPLSPLPLSHPLAVCFSILMAGQGHCQQPPQVWCHPCTGVTMGSTCGTSPGDRADRLGRPGWISLLPLWLLGMFLSRSNSVPRRPVLVFSNVSAIKISGLEWYEMNVGGILKPWL